MDNSAGPNTSGLSGTSRSSRRSVSESGDSSTAVVLNPDEFPTLRGRGARDRPHNVPAPPPGPVPYAPLAVQVHFTNLLESRSRVTQQVDEMHLTDRGANITGEEFFDETHFSIGRHTDNEKVMGIVKQPAESTFTISSKDFPALPSSSQEVIPAPRPVPPPIPMPRSASKDTSIHTSPGGNVANIPPNMIANQFGIVGLLSSFRAAESTPNEMSLALGQDLTTFGLNMNSPENLHLSFAGPWSNLPIRPQDMEYQVPPEYRIQSSLKNKLAPVRLQRYKEDLLFYFFYCFIGEAIQITAAAELYNRGWRYHMEDKMWISQAPGFPPTQKSAIFERGTYYVFDPYNWRKVLKELSLEYSKLEGRPKLPPHTEMYL